ncbi:hypothetical protein [Candidatus Solirubrobacter pratensis]|uniref:hypothetical protein n=1 Tax=Candidatus Solirubrobacter pratensis TaxID=1298857 RepID=UPI00040DF0D2|nr:hypothetical protein [Candidatus Solirubrobacter pratensis]
MDSAHARAIAERLHADDAEDDGTPLLWHIRRVARLVPPDAQVVGWLHEVLERPDVSEQELLMAGLSGEELRAIRLLNRPTHSRSDLAYLAHVELIARSFGRSGQLARVVKIADLQDRRLHPRTRPDGWCPPYALGLRRLAEAIGEAHRAGARLA